MADFLKVLAGWRGRRYVAEELYSRGFSIPRKYEEIIASQCTADERRDLDFYWEEVAREYVCSAGQTRSLIRAFPVSGTYRSAYLDELFRRDFYGTPDNGAVGSLHPCERKFILEKNRDRQIVLNVINLLEGTKAVEIERHFVDDFLWDGTKNGARASFEESLLLRGFSRVGNSFVRKSSSDLLFFVDIDTGGRSKCIGFPISLRISSDFELTEYFIYSLPRIIEGVAYYSSFRDARSAKLGIRAYVEMLDIFIESF